MRPLDLICLGRAAVDFYGEQLGSPLEDMQTFAMSLGGCAANIASGSARLGLRVAMLTRVGDEHLGRFVRNTLEKEGVDVSHVITDPTRLTGLVVLGIRDRDTFPLIFYRERCADMGLEPGDFDQRFIASAGALLVTGTHFSEEGVDRASRHAIALAKAAGTKVLLDIDYRPVLWGLTGHGRGEDRYVKSDRVSAHLLSIAADCDLIVGTEEEIHIAGGTEDTLAALAALRAVSAATIVLKRGKLGCIVFEGAIPPRLEDGFVARGLEVEVLNVLGAGDAFYAGFLRGWLRGEGLERATEYANSCGALVVSRHACSPAMPTWEELSSYLSRAAGISRIDRDEEISHLHRVTTRERHDRELAVLAFDHRIQLEALARETGAAVSRIPELKRLIAQGARRVADHADAEGLELGMIVDDRYGRQVLDEVTGTGWWLARPIEKPGTPLLELDGSADVGLTLRTWPRQHVIKCLLYHHPADALERRTHQEHTVRVLAEAARGTGHELLLELIPRRDGEVDHDALPLAMEQIYALGVRPDWWKLVPPRDPALWSRISQVIASHDRHCRGVLLLGLEAPVEVLAEGFRHAAHAPLARGFAIGRTIFAEPSRLWLSDELDDEGLISAVAERFTRTIAAWRARGARSRS